MAEGEQTQRDASGDVTPVISAAENDWWLQRLVGIVSSADITFGISLNVAGTIISGQLAGGKQYFEATAASFGAAFDEKIFPNGSGNVREFISSFRDIYVNEDGTYKVDQPDPHYIHIKNAHIFDAAGNALPNNGDGFWWRGRIREVSGFWLGEMKKS